MYELLIRIVFQVRSLVKYHFSSINLLALCTSQVFHPPLARKVDIRLPGKGNSNSHGTRPVY